MTASASAPAPAPLIAVDGVSVNFGGTRALVDVSLRIPSGQIYAIVGPNGSGKSTMLNVISRLVQPAGGTVTFGDVKLLQRPAHQLAGLGIARVFQTPVTFPGTALENILVGMQPSLKGGVFRDTLRVSGFARKRSEAIDGARALAARVGFAEQMLGRPADSLNLGEQRRLEIARALAGNPTVILLDEPAGGFNPAEVARFGELIRGLKEAGITIILVEHNVRFVRDISDSVTVLDHGAVVATGGPDVFSDERVLSVYVGSRHKKIFGTQEQADA